MANFTAPTPQAASTPSHPPSVAGAGAANPAGADADPHPRSPATSRPAGDDPSLNFGLMLHHVREGLIRRIEARLAESRVDLNFSQFRVLKVLYEGNATTSTELARWMNHDAGALTRLLDRLCQRGYLLRQTRPGDRRQVDLVLTAAGRQLAALTVDLAAQAIGHSLDPLAPDERLQLMALLGRVRETLEHPVRNASS